MGWAENRIEEYKQGQPSNWLERRMLEHANPVHFALALAASAGFIYGLWVHDWLFIVGASGLALLGHAYCWAWRKGNGISEPIPRATYGAGAKAL